ncbi:MAG: hypothetical protein O3A68_08925 [Proteobacteria bacterium]|nr:hypothetical protein [Pseudomonadota bacterium]
MRQRGLALLMTLVFLPVLAAGLAWLASGTQLMTRFEGHNQADRVAYSVGAQLASGRLQLRCLMLKDRDGFLKLGCRTDRRTPFGWDLERSDWISQRPGGEVERFEGNFLKQG